MSSSSSTSVDVDPNTITDAPNKGYELSGKIMLSAIVILFSVVIFMVLLHLYARWYLLRARRRQLQRRNRNRRHNLVFYVDSESTHSVPRGLDHSVLNSLPVFEFRQESDEKEVPECSVCLSEFENGEKGRSLPKCEHCFHIECIDMWFASHSTCPLCRAPVVAEIEKSDGVSQLGVDSVSLPVSDSAGTSSFEAQMELKGFSIEIPTMIELTVTEPVNESPRSFKSPGGRMMSLRRMLSLGLSMSSPSSVDASSSGGCCDLETGMREQTSREPGRTQSFR